MATRNYNMYKDIDFSEFEPVKPAYENNAARKIERTPAKKKQQRPQIKLVTKTKKSYEQAKSEMHQSSLQGIKILVISFVLLSMFVTMIYGRVKVDELDREIANVNTQITAAQSENVRLNMKLDSVISLKNIEDYAQNNLGMVKMESHQIEYINLSGEDSVQLSGNKQLNAQSGDDDNLISKLKAYISK